MAEVPWSHGVAWWGPLWLHRRPTDRIRHPDGWGGSRDPGMDFSLFLGLRGQTEALNIVSESELCGIWWAVPWRTHSVGSLPTQLKTHCCACFEAFYHLRPLTRLDKHKPQTWSWRVCGVCASGGWWRTINTRAAPPPPRGLLLHKWQHIYRDTRDVRGPSLH